MYRKALLFLLTAFLLSTNSSARVVTDTLYSSSKKDKVIITYEVSQEDSRMMVNFMGARKILGVSVSKKYKKQDEIDVVFFDKTGVYKNTRFDGLSTKAFMIPLHEMDYKKSSDGFFLMKQNPSIVLNVKSDQPQTLNIPIFLVHHEKKGVYTVFDQCEDLVIKLPGLSKNRSRQDIVSKKTTSKVVTTTEELGAEAPEYEYEALGLLNRINDLLVKSNLTEREIKELDDNATQLRNLSYKQFSSSEMESKVKKTLSNYDERRADLDERAQAEEKAAQKEAEEKARLAAEKEQARQDSIAAVAQQKAEEEKTRNTWMIIGGVALAVIGFGGNQVLQHLRNKKNQENIKKMQDSMVKQAEAEAKRRTASYAKEQKNQAMNDHKNNSVKENVEGKAKAVKKKSNRKISI